MNIEDGIFSHLKSFPAITNLVGSDIYIRILSQNTNYPAISFSRISSSHVQSMDGPSELGPARIQINCWSSQSPDEALQLAENVRRAMDGFDNDLGDITVQTVTMIDQGDLPNEFSEGQSKIAAFGIRQDYEIFWEDDV